MQNKRRKPTHCRLDHLVFDSSFALAGTQATLQPSDLLGDSLSLGAHQLHHGGGAGRLLLPLLCFTDIWQVTTDNGGSMNIQLLLKNNLFLA